MKKKPDRKAQKKTSRPESSRFDRLAPRKAKPRNADLPGMEDRAIKPLEDVAAEYADIRDHRMELNRQEVELKTKTLRLMKKFGKASYRRNGIEISLEPGEETVKVKIRKPSEDDEPASAGGDIELSGEGELQDSADGEGIAASIANGGETDAGI